MEYHPLRPVYDRNGRRFLQIQRRAVDIPALKEKYGDKIGFNVMIEDLQPQDTPEEIIGKVPDR